MSQMPDVTGVMKSGNSRIAYRLGEGEKPAQREGPGLVESYPDPMDRRHTMVRITPKGRALVEKMVNLT